MKRAAAVLTGLVLLAGCSSSKPSPRADQSPATLLQKARQTADAANAVHFVISSSNVSLSTTNLINGQGDLARPSSLQGSFNVAVSGFTAKVKVVAVGDTFEAELPFASQYKKTDPSEFGLTNPAELLDPANGLVKLLVIAQNPQAGPAQRLNGELLDTVTYSVPGSSIPVLPDENPSVPVKLTVGIDPSTHQLRTVTMVGPLTSAKSNCTYVVTLTDYNEHVSITLPTGS
ncbi:MAG TPA: LppX_LprAFG lipoprotein [Acidimicrobiales bacterium]|jgi:lipoprotein LprG|nr:LppX_LprAFG lipoprotein [Acidimicrobiales bacterium]